MKCFWNTILLEAESTQGPKRNRKYNDTIGNQTRNFPVCSAMPQPTASPHGPSITQGSLKNECLRFSKYCIVLDIRLLIPYDNSDSTVWFRNKNRSFIII